MHRPQNQAFPQPTLSPVQKRPCELPVDKMGITGQFPPDCPILSSQYAEPFTLDQAPTPGQIEHQGKVVQNRKENPGTTQNKEKTARDGTQGRFQPDTRTITPNHYKDGLKWL